MVVMERSSSNDLSSAPNSDTEGPASAFNRSNTIIVSRDGPSSHLTASASGLKGNGGLTTDNGDGRQDLPPKQRKPRKKKDSDAAATPTEKKEKGTRRPRGASTSAGSTRKKMKTEISTPTNLLANVPPAIEPAPSRLMQQNVIDLTTQTSSTTNEAAKFPQNGFLNTSSTMSPPKPNPPHYNPTPPPQPPVVRSMAYDPVRSLTMPRVTESVNAAPRQTSSLSTPPRVTYNPSTSPAISGIINPPESTTSNREQILPTYQSQIESQHVTNANGIKSSNDNVVMEIDPPVIKAESAKPEPAKKATPEAAPAKPVTKPRAKEQPPPLPTGSGLLSSNLFGGDSGMDSHKSSSDRGTSIVLHVDLKNPNNKVINFARMAEEKYGFAALYPRQAAQKERLAKVAAAGAALERAGAGIKGTPAGESGDEDVSVDIDRESDNEGDIVMSGMNGTGDAVNSGTDGPVPKRRKRKDEYDADDPFVDDSELLWEAQAAASKDGFFVYCGPLVPEGEKPAVERADGTVKRGRGRGRGGGPGSRGGRGAATAARDAEGGSSRGGGPGSRGGGITRKPRITKAERQQRELEKKQREQMAVLAAKPPNYQS